MTKPGPPYSGIYPSDIDEYEPVDVVTVVHDPLSLASASEALAAAMVLIDRYSSINPKTLWMLGAPQDAFERVAVHIRAAQAVLDERLP